MHVVPQISRVLRLATLVAGLSSAPMAFSPSMGVATNDACATDQNAFCCRRLHDTCVLSWGGGGADYYEFWGYECP